VVLVFLNRQIDARMRERFRFTPSAAAPRARLHWHET